MTSEEKFLEMFREEAEEHMGTLRDGFMELENNPDDLSPVQKMYRAAHTLKGNAGGVGLDNIQDIMHKVENLMSAVRDEEIAIDLELIDLAHEALDRVEELVEVAESDEDPPFDVEAFVDRLVHAVEEGEEPDSGGDDSSVELTGEQIETLAEFDNLVLAEVYHSDDAAMAAVRHTLVHGKIADAGAVEHMISFPGEEGIEDEKFQDHVKYILAGEDHALKEFLEQLESGDGEIAAIELEDISSEADTLEEEYKPEPSGTTGSSGTAEIKKASTLRVKSDTLDFLLNTLSELTVKRRSLEHKLDDYLDSHSDVSGDFIEIKRLIDQLREGIMSTRLLPINQIFSRFPRLVRDISRELDKKVNLEIEGEQTELDKKIVDQLGDPLVHILRNALDHGIESPEERREKGKPEEGTIELKAYYEGNDVVIEVNDDGGGIPPDMIIEQAIEKDLVSEEEAEEMTDHEKIQYILEPGFSTAREVTDLSGRGVGLDVVRTTVEKFRGDMTIESELDRGTTFKIRFPLTMAIVPAFLVQITENRYVIPLESVERTETITSDQISVDDNSIRISLEDTELSGITLNELYGYSSILQSNSDQDVYPLMIVEQKNGRRIGCLCEEILDQDDFIINPLGDFLSGLNGFSGLTLLGGGEASLILDIEERLDEWGQVA